MEDGAAAAPLCDELVELDGVALFTLELSDCGAAELLLFTELLPLTFELSDCGIEELFAAVGVVCVDVTTPPRALAFGIPLSFSSLERDCAAGCLPASRSASGFVVAGFCFV